LSHGPRSQNDTAPPRERSRATAAPPTRQSDDK
jgi:hypothetical protein